LGKFSINVLTEHENAKNLFKTNKVFFFMHLHVYRLLGHLEPAMAFFGHLVPSSANALDGLRDPANLENQSKKI
jgi:hypothetical protein